ncbi:alpha/beta hydrolase [Schaalia cardiffensis]|uniref:alpha/beta fold hydrolase n=1 Tax=Schaalia cardiffensis TaxID=181487 RepID=UPI002AB214C5|nr:alpha/beta hydrolase [Schaalia cardiffensis]
MPQTLQERAYRTNSGDVAYWVDASANTDMPWLVFLPGLTADHTLFDAQMAHFSGKAKCLVWDAPAHGKSRPYPLDFSMDDCARILRGVLEAENVKGPVLVGQSLGGYVAQAFIDLYPGEAFGFVSIDSAPLKRKYYPTWEVKALRHTKSMYRSMPWSWLKSLGSWGVATTAEGKASMRSFMESYTKEEYVELAAHGYTMLADAVESGRAYDIDCPALLLCGEKDRAGDVKVFNRKWSAGESIPLVWVPDAGHNSNADNPSFVNSQIEQLMTTL